MEKLNCSIIYLPCVAGLIGDFDEEPSRREAEIFNRNDLHDYIYPQRFRFFKSVCLSQKSNAALQ
jgi:hypothetical protein